MKLRLFVAALAALLSASPSLAQLQSARDQRASQAVADTLGASLKRRGIAPGSTPYNTAIAATDQELRDLNEVNPCFFNSTFFGRLACLVSGGLLPNGLPLGRDNEALSNYCRDASTGALELCPGVNGSSIYGGGSFGGGGNTGSWGDGGGGTPSEARSCGLIDLSLDVAGNLIIPSFALSPSMGFKLKKSVMYLAHNTPGTYPQSAADNPEATALRYWHQRNLQLPREDWYGVVGVLKQSSFWCTWVATVARKNPDGSIKARVQDIWCPDGNGAVNTQAAATDALDNIANPPFTGTHKDCPDASQGGGGNYHWYGGNNGSYHWDYCIAYAPGPGGFNGYAINNRTTLTPAQAATFPFGVGITSPLASFLSQCGVDPELFRALTDLLFKRATEEPGYDGPPYEPIEPGDSRPGDTKVGDLEDDPETPGTPPTPNPDTPTPDPENPLPETPGSGGGTDVCDFGPGGCDNPNTGAPTLEEPNTGFMDPIWDWLPDLPSITIPDMSQSCPVWNLNLTEWGGSEWQFLIDKHCELMETDVVGHGTLSGAIGLLVVGLAGIWAARHVLSA